MATGLNLIVQENDVMVRMGLQNLAADIPQVGRLGVYRTAQRIVIEIETTRKSCHASDSVG